MANEFMADIAELLSQETELDTPEEVNDQELTEADDSEQEEEDSEEEVGADESDEDIPELDASITDPVARRRWAEQWKGLNKQKNKLEEKEQEIEQQLEGVKGLQSIAVSLQDPNKYKQTVQQILKAVSEEHQTTVEEILGLTTEIDDTSFDDYDKKLMNKTVELALKKWESKYGFKLQEIENLQKVNQQEAAFMTKVNEDYSRMKAKVSKLNQGFEITKEQYAKAIKAHPSLEPYKAIQAEYVEEIIKHRTNKAQVKKAPEINRSQQPIKKEVQLSRAGKHEWMNAISDLVKDID